MGGIIELAFQKRFAHNLTASSFYSQQKKKAHRCAFLKNNNALFFVLRRQIIGLSL